ncbi:Ubiquitin-conjugating enzyme E2 W [Candida viswanathii]|uniref:Ubiquitin-conjugating enzyme E2 W n=1 Tax=Candida viswanathii TaxID=5486 RepID=A0A367XMM9_9ASCO|nr:Ubiquitin-conjugating enzyme E2 W [Candida viswanathii]
MSSKPHPFHKRLLKEYQGLLKSTNSELPGITFVNSDDSLTDYIFQIKVSGNGSGQLVNTIYPPDEMYFLNIKITDNYPVDSPQVKFIIYDDWVDEEGDGEKAPKEGSKENPISLDASTTQLAGSSSSSGSSSGSGSGGTAAKVKPKSVIPIHPHIYSNGHICLNLLGDDWTPACLIESILLSIQSMLNTNDKRERPPDDRSYIRHAPLNPKNSKFVYHDDSV